MDLIELIEHFGRTQFFGEVTLKFESGKLVHIKRTESIKPEQLSKSIRGREDETRRSSR